MSAANAGAHAAGLQVQALLRAAVQQCRPAVRRSRAAGHQQDWRCQEVGLTTPATSMPCAGPTRLQLQTAAGALQLLSWISRAASSRHPQRAPPSMCFWQHIGAQSMAVEAARVLRCPQVALAAGIGVGHCAGDALGAAQLPGPACADEAALRQRSARRLPRQPAGCAATQQPGPGERGAQLAGQRAH